MLFKHFLRRNNALQAFNRNLKEDGKDESFFIEVSEFSYFSAAFIYFNTIEGKVYWQNLSRKWRQFLHQKGIIKINPSLI